MELHLFQKGFHYAQDGPGNRLVYHLQGCNLHCPWCSNPEGMALDSANTVDVVALVEEARSAKVLFFDGGGVTFTGGEATVQFEALKEALRMLRAQEIHTAIETNATSPRLPELFGLLDLLILDLKHPDSAAHRQATGLSNETILQNIAAAAESGIPMLVRVPMIGGFNTDSETQTQFLEIFRQINRENVCFELLKYHEYGKDKWAACGKPYTMENAFVTEATRQQWETDMRSIGLRVIRT